MHKAVAVVVLLASLAVCGCASMCDSSYDCDYHAFGGMRDRVDRTHGRVGSVFDPAQAAPSILPKADKAASAEEAPTASEKGQLAPNLDEDSEDVQKLLDALDEMKSKLPVIPQNDASASDAI